MRRLATIALCAGALLASSATDTAAQPAAPAPAPRTLALTISGGVSLGAYEAGFLYYAIEAMRRNPGLLDLKLVTGASAGSINGLLSILATCGDSAASPRESLFWRTWVPLGFKQLFSEGEKSAVGLFSRRSFDVSRIARAWDGGLRATCDVVLGVSTTRVKARELDLAGTVKVPRAEERFAVRIQGAGPGRPPRTGNYVDPRYGFSQPMLPLDGADAKPFESLRDLLFASSAFPVAFAPQELAYCLTDPAAPDRPCARGSARTDAFIDGGIFDNQPLRFAARLAGAGLRNADRFGWQSTPDFGADDLPKEMLFVYLDPDDTQYPIFEEKDPGGVKDSLVELLRRTFGGFVSTVRSKELSSLLEDRPGLSAGISVAQRHYPTASEFLGNFFGFFETDFRVFDFYLGMYDARRMLDEDVAPRLRGDASAPPPVHPEPWADGAGAEAVPAAWRPFACVRAVLDDRAELAPACAAAELANFRVLLQVSLDRLYDNCARFGPKGPRTRHRHCNHAMAGGAPPRVPGVRASGAWRRDKGEAELTHAMRLLAAYDFTFTDLGVAPHHGDQAMMAVRLELGRVIDRLANAQSSGERALLKIIAQPAANILAYAPPAHLLYVTAGRWEFGWSTNVFLPRWLRMNAALEFLGLESALSSERTFFAAAPLLGLELELTSLSGTLLQPRFGLRGGYVFSTGDAVLTDACDQQEAAGTIGYCSRFVTQAVVSLTAYEHLRLQLVGEWYPALRSTEKHEWSVAPSVGVQFASPF